jgi:adenosine deaminase
MVWNIPSSALAIYKRYPKVDLHRHLEGSLRVDTLMDIARKHGITLPLRPDLKSMVQMQPDDPLTFTTFLAKFQILRLFYLSPEIIDRITYEVVADAAKDQVRYLELRFTPVALSNSQRFYLADVMDWVAEAARRASRDHGIQTRLIASINRHEPVHLAEQVAKLAIERAYKGIVGLDLAGNEAMFPAAPFKELFGEAKKEGLKVTVHAGEWNGAENVREAIEDFATDRIGHGVRVVTDEAVMALARERGTAFEVCITSNYQTGVVQVVKDHPLVRMLAGGLNVTINTDDPGISGITLSDEYSLAVGEMGLGAGVLKDCIVRAAKSSFLPEEERLVLTQSLQDELKAFPA